MSTGSVLGYGSTTSTNDSPASSVVVTAPAPAATSGPKIRSHSGRRSSDTDSARSSAAAIGVPNIAPIVPANASPAQARTGTTGSSRRPIRTARLRLSPMIGFSGPRLTPPASVTTMARASPGRTISGCGGSTSPAVAGSGPAWPGTNVRISPVASPAAVSTPKIQIGSAPVSPTATGSRSHRTCSTTPARRDSAIRVTLEPAPTRIAGRTIASSARAPVPGAAAGDNAGAWMLGASWTGGPSCVMRPLSVAGGPLGRCVLHSARDPPVASRLGRAPPRLRHRRVPRRARADDHGRRPARHRDRPRDVDPPPRGVVDHQRLPAGLHRHDARRRPARRPVRRPAAVPVGDGRVHDRVAPGRGGAVAGAPDRRTPGPGGGRRRADPGRDGGGLAPVHGRLPAAGARARRRHDVPGHGRRPVPRRGDPGGVPPGGGAGTPRVRAGYGHRGGPRPRLALGVLRERPHRHRGPRDRLGGEQRLGDAAARGSGGPPRGRAVLGVPPRRARDRSRCSAPAARTAAPTPRRSARCWSASR